MSEWGPWQEHDGKGCPCVGHFVEAVIKGNKTGRTWTATGRALGGRSWFHNSSGVSFIIRYRIRRPKGLTILEGLLENLPEDVDARNTLTAG